MSKKHKNKNKKSNNQANRTAELKKDANGSALTTKGTENTLKHESLAGKTTELSETLKGFTGEGAAKSDEARDDSIKKIEGKAEKSPEKNEKQTGKASEKVIVDEKVEKITRDGEKVVLAEKVEENWVEAGSDEEIRKDKKTKNDQWSAEEIEKDIKKAEKNDHRSVEPKIVEIEVDGVGKRRRRGWIWWIIGGILVILLAGGAWLALAQNWSNDSTTDEKTEERPVEEEIEKPIEDESKEDENPAEEEKPAEEMPKEEEKPVEEPKTDPEPTVTVTPHPEMPPKEPTAPAGSKIVALTFDDGPSPATTPRLLDILAERNVKVTFFVLGNLAQRNPGILQREAAEGHEVGSHTMYHNQLTTLSYAQVQAEAAEMDRIFTETLGTVTPFTRPPYGSYNATVGQALGQPMILWSVDPRDWADRNASVVCSRVTSAAVDGSIILVHDIHATTVDAVPCIIDGLRTRGFEFVTVSELAASRGVTLVNGQAYFSF